MKKLVKDTKKRLLQIPFFILLLGIITVVSMVPIYCITGAEQDAEAASCEAEWGADACSSPEAALAAGNAARNSSSATTDTTTATAPAATSTAPVTDVQASEARKTIKHGLYDTIDSEFIRAFKNLTTDGTPESCFLTVKSDADCKEVPISMITYTLVNKENGKITFMKQNEDKEYTVEDYSILLNQVGDEAVEADSEEDTLIDLGLSVEKATKDTYEGYDLSFKKDQSLPFKVSIVYPLEAEKTYYVYTIDGDEFTAVCTCTSEEDGTVTFETDNFRSYFFTETDVIADKEAIQAQADADAKAQADAEAKTKADADAKALADKEAQKEADANALYLEETKQQQSYLLVGIVVAVVVVAGVSYYMVKKKKSSKGTEGKKPEGTKED